jgi:hypothetical protein
MHKNTLPTVFTNVINVTFNNPIRIYVWKTQNYIEWKQLAN